VSENVELKYVHAFVDRYGKTRCYFRRNGKRTPLPGAPGTHRFMEAYGALLAGQQPGTRPATAEPTPRSFRALATLYYASPNYTGRAASTRSGYRQVIETFLKEHGDRRVDEMRREHVDKIVGAYADRPGAGIVLLKRIRTLCRYAVALRWADFDPTAGVKAYKSRERHAWTEDELAQFERHWPIGTRQRLGFALALYTGQRSSDVHRMTWPDIAGDRINVAQQKSGDRTRLKIPLHPKLAAVLAQTKKEHIAILTFAGGKPYTVQGYGKMMGEAISAAGLPDRCMPHGLRKAASRRLAEAGCSTREIMAITGHKTLAEVERYTREADQERLARAAIRKQVKNG
jgi:enterobacteria phage integrase